MVLAVEGVTKQFGGVTAVRHVSLNVREEEIVGIIGPNGAGKSTLFDIIAGVHRPEAGRVVFRDTEITGWVPHRVNRFGVGRTFQKLRPFGDMTVEDNILVAGLPRTPSIRTARQEARHLLETVGLLDKALAFARQLSTGQRKRLEIARALATRPSLLLLDEVTGGVDQPSIPGLLALVRSLRDQGVTVLLIEHNMRVVTSISDRVVALHLGEVIAQGAPAEVMRNPDVVNAYLGQTYAAS